MILPSYKMTWTSLFTNASIADMVDETGVVDFDERGERRVVSEKGGVEGEVELEVAFGRVSRERRGAMLLLLLLLKMMLPRC